MKKLLSIFCALFIHALIFAQVASDPVKKYSLKHEIGFNATQLVANLFSTNPDDLGKFSFIYKFHPYRKGGIRLGFGGQYFDNTQNINFTEKRNNKIIEGNLRVGYEFRKALGKQWRTLLGVDGFVQDIDRTTTFSSSVDVVTTQAEAFSYGVSPFFGIEFKINQHIRLSTELAVAYSIIQNKETDIFQKFPEFNETIENNNTEFNLNSPGFLYLTVRL